MKLKNKILVIAVLSGALAYTSVSALTTLDNSVSRAIPYLQKLWVTQQGDQTSNSIVQLSGNRGIQFPVGNSPIQPSQILQAPEGQFVSTAALTGGSFYTGSVTTHHILDGSLLLIDFRANLNVVAAASGSCSLGYAAISITGGNIVAGNCVPVSTFAWNTLRGTNPCPVGYGIQGYTNTGLVLCNASSMGTLQATYFSDYWRVSSTNANDIYYGTGGASCITLAVYTHASSAGWSARCGCDTDPNALDAACNSTGAIYSGAIPGGTIPPSLGCVDIDTVNNVKVAHTINVVNAVVGGTSQLQFVPSPNTSSTLNTSARCGCDVNADGGIECSSPYTGANVWASCVDQRVQYPASYIPWGLNGRVMTENYNLAGNVPSTGSVCTGTGDVGVGLDTPVEKLHVKLQGADISCSTYTGTIGVGGGVWAQAAWLGGYLNNNNLGFANCSCDTNPLTLDCQVYNSGGTLLNYPIPISPYQGPAIPGYSPYYIYMPSPMPANNNCVDQYSVAGNAKYYRWSRENYAETYDDLEVNAVPYTGLITSCTTGEATFRVDNSGLLFAPGMLIFTGGTATTTGTVVTTGVVTGSLHLSGDIYGYWRTIAGPLNDLTNVVSCSCDSGGSTRDCPVLDSGFNALQTAPYVAPTANFAAGVGIILNWTAQGTWNLKPMFTGGNGQFYPYSGFDGVQQATVSTAGNNFGNCYDKFTSGGVTWYDEFVGFTNKTIPGNHERDEFVSVSTTAGTIGSCWFNITDDQIDYPIRMPWGAPIFWSYPWINNTPFGHFIPQWKGTATYNGGTIASISWATNTTVTGGMQIWIAPKKIGSADCYDKFRDGTTYKYLRLQDSLNDGDAYTVDYFNAKTLNKTITITTGTVTTGTVVYTGTPASAYRASYVGATTVSYNGANLMTRTDAHVGINKEFPSTDFNVVGNVRLQSLADTSMTYLAVKSTGLLTTTGTVNILSGAAYTWYVTGDYWSQGLNGAVYYNNGNVGIGTNTPTDKLQVMGDVRANNYYSNSDSTLKRNITDLGADDPTGALATFLLLRGKTFRWVGDGNPGMGVIAQEVAEVYPNLVRTDSNDYRSVLYMNLVAPAITAINALNTMIANHTDNLISAQNAAISSLDGRIRNLERRR